MYSIEKANGQLKLRYDNNVEYYEFPTIKSVGSSFDTLKGKYYVSINFIANDKNNSLRIYLAEVSNQPSWTDTSNGAQVAVEDISFWIASSTLPSLSGIAKRAGSIRVSNTSGVISLSVKSISFANTGTVNVTYTIDGTPTTLKPGETVSFDAGDVNNYFDNSTFGYNAPTASSDLLIAYTF